MGNSMSDEALNGHL